MTLARERGWSTRVHRVIAILWLAVALLTATPSITAEASNQVGGSFKQVSTEAIGTWPSSDFKFKTTLPDRGGDVAGGWQEAEAKLGVVDARHVLAMSWNCNVKIGMPLRAQAVGPISLGYAASVAADVANKAAK